jgi:hypothetical protein
MRRFVVKVVAFVLGIAALCAAAAPLDSLADVRVVGPKLAHLREHGGEYELLFFGSSYVHREFVPSVLDAELARRGIAVRSFNVGVPGMDPPETYFLVEKALESSPSTLRCVLVELDYYRTTIRERNLHTRRNDYWHDGYFAGQAVRATLEESTDPRFRAKTVARHLDAFARNFLHAGRGRLYLLSALGSMPDAAAVASALGPDGDGFTALDDRTTTRAELRGELFEDLELDVFEEKVGALRSGTVRDADADRVPTRTEIEALAKIVRRIRSVGARPVLVVPPCLDARAKLIEIVRSSIDADVLVFNDPERFPALYDASNRFDVGHLNKAGAVLFTTSLAEALAPILASPAVEGL